MGVNHGVSIPPVGTHAAREEDEDGLGLSRRLRMASLCEAAATNHLADRGPVLRVLFPTWRPV